MNERGPDISNFLRKAETFVDLVSCRWILRGIWLVAAIPCFCLSLLGIAFGGNIVLSSSIFSNGWLGAFACLLIGVAGIAGIVGAAIRLSNIAESLAEHALRRITAKACLSVGLIASVVLLAAMAELIAPFFSLAPAVDWSKGIFVVLLFAATIGIMPLADSSAVTDQKRTTPI